MSKVLRLFSVEECTDQLAMTATGTGSSELDSHEFALPMLKNLSLCKTYLSFMMRSHLDQ
jgi:hypothetical protein